MNYNLCFITEIRDEDGMKWSEPGVTPGLSRSYHWAMIGLSRSEYEVKPKLWWGEDGLRWVDMGEDG